MAAKYARFASSKVKTAEASPACSRFSSGTARPYPDGVLGPPEGQVPRWCGVTADRSIGLVRRVADRVWRVVFAAFGCPFIDVVQEVATGDGPVS